MYGAPNKEPLYIDPINYDNYMTRVFAGNFTLQGMLMHHISMVERELEALFRHRNIFLKYGVFDDPWKEKLHYLQGNPNAVFQFHASANLIASGELLPDYITSLSKHLCRVRNEAFEHLPECS
jgi:hypothetical protein